MRIRVLSAALIVLGALVPAALAHEPPQPNAGGAGPACENSPAAGPDDDSFNGRFCRNVGEFARLRGDICREAAGDTPCGHLDGRSITPESVEEYEASWAHAALARQRLLDDDVPLAEALWPHTHNSYNSSSYRMSVSNSDPNQLYSLTDQLRMDMRILELDIHWHGNQVVLCHGEPVDAGATTVHAGCSVDRLLAEGLAEIRAWLDSNPDEVIGIYLENALDGEEAAHNAAVDALEAELGALVYRPSNGACDALPANTVSRRDIRESGARVWLVGNSGPGDWCQWVHERDQRSTWWESGDGFGSTFPAYPACVGYLAERTGGRPWVRLYEDSTWLSQMAGGGGEVTVEETQNMVGCGVTMPGFDQLHPHDPRLGALVWSWSPEAPLAAGCGFQGTDGRLHTDAGCERQLPAACATSAGDWAVTAPVARADASAACAALGGQFATPWNGRENNELAALGAGDTWVSFTS